MGNRNSTTCYSASTSIILITILLLLMTTLFSTATTVLGNESVTGAIWTTDPNGERVNGNLFTNARKVNLCGGPHKAGSAGLPDGIYYFQVTDPPGKTLLSTDTLPERRFEVKYGYVYSIDGGTHKWNDDTTRGYGISVQLWPFIYMPKVGGVYKVWVTLVDNYAEGQGCFGFVPSLSKTDNFKVGRKLDELPKYFELWVTERISEAHYVEFYVNYTIDGDGDPNTIDPAIPWTTGQLTFDRAEGGYHIFRYETTFAMDTYIYWKFFVLNTFTLTSDMYGPELINQEGMVNKETLFMVYGHKYDYREGTGLEGWTIELYKDDVKVAETQTDPEGNYELIGMGQGNFTVCEIAKRDEGWAPFGLECYEFIVEGSEGRDFTFDFYNYKMLRLSETSENRCELSSFDVVFTPSNEEPEMYKLSSTNPGSFYYNVAKFGDPGGNIEILIDLPLDGGNADFDSPNFIFHHTYIGDTPVVDIHVYAGRQDTSPCGSPWVPDWSSDVTNSFDIDISEDGKHAAISGPMPSTGEVFVTAHIDYQISASLTWEEVQMFNDFEYTFAVTVYYSIEGVTFDFPVGAEG